MVSIHAPARGATRGPRALKPCSRSFNPRPRAGGDSSPHATRCRPACFNPRPRAGGDAARAALGAHPGGFNPRPRAGGDTLLERPVADAAVSIHAPARGATPRSRTSTRTGTCFNPRPRAGGRPHRAVARGVARRFQSTPPRGGRLPRRRRPRSRREVSIHAPARGATSMASISLLYVGSFNPRPRAGGDAGSRSRWTPLGRFNPRPRAGGDLAQAVPRKCQRVFQSTPPRGGRPARRSRAPSVRWCFNPRPRAGGDRPRPGSVFRSESFNPRPRAGGDLGWRRRRALPNGFNPRPRAGGDLPSDHDGPGDHRFNPRPRAGGDCPRPLR